MRDVLFVGKDVEVEAVCHNVDFGGAGLEVEYTYADGTALIEFDSIDDMLQFSADVKLWALQLKAKRQGPKGCPCPSHSWDCDCGGMAGDR